MKYKTTILLLGILVLFSGCTGLVDELDGGDDSTPEGDATPIRSPETPGSGPEEPEVTPSPTPVETPTPSPTPSVDPANPFGAEQLTVAVNQSADSQDVESTVTSALDFWAANAEEYAGYPVEFVRTNGTSPDVLIEFEDGPITCEASRDRRTPGCAPHNDENVDTPSKITIPTGYTQHVTEDVAIHQLGHVLGVEHVNAPQSLADGGIPQGIHREEVKVYGYYANGNDLSGTRKSQITQAMDFFETTTLLNESDRVDWRFVEDVSEADLLVEIASEGADCPLERTEVGEDATGGSCFVGGTYADQDRIVVSDVDTTHEDWHVASLLAERYFETDRIPFYLLPTADDETRDRWYGIADVRDHR